MTTSFLRAAAFALAAAASSLAIGSAHAAADPAAIVKHYAEEAGVRATPHTFRHQAITWLTRHSGMADAELWIADGRVAVNGRTLDSANVVVGEGDRITVDGHPLAKRERTRLFLFHKPRGLVTTTLRPASGSCWR